MFSAGSIVTKIGADLNPLKTAFGQARKEAGGFAKSMDRTLGSVGEGFARIGRQVAAVGVALGTAAIAGAAGLGVWAIKLAADAETAQVSFTTMLGSVEKAKALMSEISSFAADTPFQTAELVKSATSLLAAKVAAEQIVPVMRSLGDVSAGLNIPIAELAVIYGKARSSGRLMGDDLNQLTGRGIPLVAELAKQFGVAESEVRGLVEQGKVGFPNLQRALVSLTTKGGQFAGLTEAQSKTIAGRFSTLQDAVSMSMTNIGKIIAEKLDLKAAIAGVSSAIEAMARVVMPQIEALLGGLSETGNLGQRAGAMVLSAAEWMATGVGYVLDAVEVLKTGWHAMRTVAGATLWSLLKPIDALVQALDYLYQKLTGKGPTEIAQLSSQYLAQVEKDIKASASATAKAAQNVWEGKNANAAAAFFDQVRANSAAAAEAAGRAGTTVGTAVMQIDQAAQSLKSAKADEALAAIREELERFGLSDSAKAAMDFGMQAGVTYDLVEQFATMRAELEKLNTTREKANELAEEGKRIFEQTRNPMELYEAQIERLNKLLEAQSIDWDTYGRAVREAREKLESATPKAQEQKMREDPKLATFIKAGSAQAVQFAFQSRMGRDDIPKKQLAVTEQVERHLGRIVTNTESVTVVV